MRFKVNKKINWFSGEINSYDELSGKYGVYLMVKQFLFSLMIRTLDMLTERPNFRHLKINLKSNFQSLL